MEKRKSKMRLIGLAAIICLGIAFMNSPLYAKDVKVPIGLNLELTGGLAATTIPVSYGLLDYITHINDSGGWKYTANGTAYKARYDITWADNGFTVARSMTNVRRFAEQGAKVILTA